MSAVHAPSRAVDAERRVGTPYIGLVPYAEEDAAFFFGRAQEKQIVAGNLRAYRLTILCGPSGVGKTSLLQAGVVHDLRERVRADGPAASERARSAVCSFNAWRRDPLPELVDTLYAAVSEALPGEKPHAPARGEPLVETMQMWTERVRTLLVVLDQFEDYFLYHPHEEGEGTFAAEFPRVVNEPNLRVNFLLSLREDALAKLDRFTGQIPNLFGNLLRLDALDYRSAREAIVEPVAEYNRFVDDREQVGIEDGFVEAVLEQVASGRIMLGDRGRGMSGASALDVAQQHFETPYLQLVMLRVWSAERSVGSNVLRRETLERLGGAERIIRTHLDGAMSGLSPGDQKIASKAFRYLVTPSNTKVAYTTGDLAEYTGVAPDRLAPVLDRLAAGQARILRIVAGTGDEPAYEIFHDALAAAVLDWRSRFSHLRTRRRLQALAVTAFLAAIAALVGLGLWGLAFRSTGGSVENQLRTRIVAASDWAVDHKAQIYYSQGTRRLAWLTRKPRALPLYIDGSSFVTWCYWIAGAQNPNGSAYSLKGVAYTGTLLLHMKHIPRSSAGPGDVVVWKSPSSPTGLAAALVAEGGPDPLLVSHGSNAGPVRIRFSEKDAELRAGSPGIRAVWLTIF